MYVIISILIIIAAILLTLVVLVQNSKGGGLASNFAGSTQIMGVSKTTDFIEKATWGLAIALVVLSLLAGFATDSKKDRRESLMKEQIEKAPVNPSMPQQQGGGQTQQQPKK